MKFLKILLVLSFFVFNFGDIIVSEYFFSKSEKVVTGQSVGSKSQSIGLFDTTNIAFAAVGSGVGPGVCQLTGAGGRQIFTGLGQGSYDFYCCNVDRDCSDIASGLGFTGLIAGRDLRCRVQSGYSCISQGLSGYDILKFADISTGNTNQIITYSIEIINKSDSTGNDIAITDNFASGFVFSGFITTPPGTGITSNTGLSRTTQSLGIDEIVTISYQGYYTNSGIKNNIASLSGCIAGQCYGTATVFINEAVPVLIIDKAYLSGGLPYSGIVYYESTGIYSLVISNNGSGLSSGVIITDALPSGFVYQGYSANNGTLIYDTGTHSISRTGLNIQSGAVASLSILGQRNYTNGGFVTNFGFIENSGYCSITGAICNDSITVQLYNSGLIISKTGSVLSGAVGQIIQFIVTVINDSIYTNSGIVVSDTIPTTFSGDFIPSQGTYTGNQWNVGSLSAGSSAILIISGVYLDSGQKYNIATITSGYKIIFGDLITSAICTTCTANASMYISLLSGLQTGVSISKSTNADGSYLGQIVSYSININNTGFATSNINIHDSIPSNFVLTSFYAQTGSFSSGSYDWTIPLLSNNTNYNLILSGYFLSGGTVTNNVIISGCDNSNACLSSVTSTINFCGDGTAQTGNGEQCDGSSGCSVSCSRYTGSCSEVSLIVVPTTGLVPLTGFAYFNIPTGFTATGLVWNGTSVVNPSSGASTHFNVSGIYPVTLNLGHLGAGTGFSCQTSLLVGESSLCGPVSGSVIYDSNNSGDSLNSGSSNLCSSGAITGFTYNTGTHSWSRNCSGTFTTTTCSAYETYCGDNITQTGNGEQCDGQSGCTSSCSFDTPVCYSLTISPNPVYPLQTTTISASGSIRSSGYLYFGSLSNLIGTGNPISYGTSFNTTGTYSFIYQVSNPLSGNFSANCSGSLIVADSPITGSCNAFVSGNTYYTGSSPNTGTLCWSGTLTGLNQYSSGWSRSCTGASSGGSQSCMLGIQYCGDNITQTGNGEQCDGQSGCNTSCQYDTPICYGIIIGPNPIFPLQTVTINASGSVRSSGYLYLGSLANLVGTGNPISYSTSFNNTGTYNFIYQLANPLSGTLIANCSGNLIVTEVPVTGLCNNSISGNSYYTGSLPNTGSLCSSGTMTGLIQNSTGRSWSCTGAFSGGNQSCSLAVLEVPITGTCNISIDGNDYYTGSTPSTGSLCSSGSLTGLVFGSTGRTWTCNGQYSGRNQTCSLTVNEIPVTGTCNSGINGNSYYTGSTPAAGSLCSSGNLSGLTLGSTGWTWSCDGYNSGGNNSCSLNVLPLPITGSCNAPVSGNTYYSGSTPSTGTLCSTGTLTGLNQNSSGRSWGCQGSNSGGNQSCLLNIEYCGDLTTQTGNGEQCDGQSGCNTSCQYDTPICYGIIISPDPAFPLQSVTISASGSVRAIGGLYLGSLSGLLGTGNPISYGTSFVNTGIYGFIYQLTNPLSGTLVASCSGNLVITDEPITGTCNALVSGNTYYTGSTPSTGALCSSGFLTGLNQTSSGWIRSCSGYLSGGGQTCSLNVLEVPVTGTCNSNINGNNYYTGSTPSTGTLCSSGNLSGLLFGLTGRTWACEGYNSGGNNSCGFNVLPLPITGTCNTSVSGNTYYSGSAPSTGSLCSGGALTGLTQSSSGWSWSCQGSSSGGSQSCSLVILDIPITGICNTSINGSNYYTDSTPNTGSLCYSGTLSGLNQTSTGRAWSCVGQYSGEDQNSCSLNVLPLPITGTCNNSISGNSYYTGSMPATGLLCSSGTLTGLTQGISGRNWTCQGTDSGGSQSCLLNIQYCGDNISQSGEQCDGNVGCSLSCNRYTGSCSDVNLTVIPSTGLVPLTGSAYFNIPTGFTTTGLIWNGTSVINPLSGISTQFTTSGMYTIILNLGHLGDGTGLSCQTSLLVGDSPVCGSTSGSVIYDSNNSGDSLNSGSSNLCSSGSVTGFTYNTGTHSWSWSCSGTFTTTTCSAYETYCGDNLVQTGNGEQCDGQSGCNTSCQYNTPVCYGLIISPNPVYPFQSITISASGSVWAFGSLHLGSLTGLLGTGNPISYGTSFNNTGTFGFIYQLTNPLSGTLVASCSGGLIVTEAPITGSCNISVSRSSYYTGSLPSTGSLCSSGTLTGLNQYASGWSWSCAGAFSGGSQSCNLSILEIPITGTCNTSIDGNDYYTGSMPGTGSLCSSGSLTGLALGSTGRTWSCEGLNSGSNDDCSLNILPLPITGTCNNTVSGNSYYTGSAPATGTLCSSGSLSGLIQNSTGRIWSCNGQYSGGDQTCNLIILDIPITGICNASIDGNNYYTGSTPSTGSLCSSGNLSGLALDSTGRTWSCEGYNSGGSNSCSLNILEIPINGSCNSSISGSSFYTGSTPTTGSLCSSGTLTGLSQNSTGRSRSCDGQFSGGSQTCNLTVNEIPVTGTCNSGINGNNYYTGSTPSIGSLCSSGNLSGLNQNSGGRSRTCQGTNSGGNQSCFLSIEYCGDSLTQTGNGEQCDGQSGCNTSCQYDTPVCFGLIISPNPAFPLQSITITASGSVRAIGGLYFGSLSGLLGTGNPISYGTSVNNTGVYNFIYQLSNPLSGTLIASCSGNLLITDEPITGDCNASISGNTYYTGSTPSTGSLCSSGNLSGLTLGSTGWTWACEGYNSGGSNSCSLNVLEIPITGICNNSISGSSYYTGSTPSTGSLCSTGTLTGLQQYANGRNRTCGGQYSGNNQSCSLTVLVIPITGSCNVSVNGNSYNTGYAPATGTLCSTGTLTGFNQTSTGQSRSCEGQYSGGSDNCSLIILHIPITGSCNFSISGNTYYTGSTPSTGSLCSTGILTGLDQDASKRSWTCNGQYSGGNQSCNLTVVEVPVTGQCDAGINGNSYYTGSTPNSGTLCSSGNLLGLNQGSTGRTWSCEGYNSGGSNSCSLNVLEIPITGTCNASISGNNYYTGATPSTGSLCSSGILTGLNQGPSGRTRSCEGQYSGATNNCNLNVFENPVTGACHSSINGTDYYTGSQPSTGSLCTSGTLSGLNQTSTGWTWSCEGIFSGGNQNACYINILEIPITGSCNNSISGNLYYTGSTPSTGSLCSNGTLTGLSQTSTGRTRSCDGQFSGGNQSCNLTVLELPTTGSCNTSISGNTYYAGLTPDTGSLCSHGTLTGLNQGSSGRSWSCAGTYSGITQSCNLTISPLAITGSCNITINNGVYYTGFTPSSGSLCSDGTLSGLVLGSNNRIRNCQGYLSGASENGCNLTILDIPITGTCNSSIDENDYYTGATPSTGSLCSSGAITGLNFGTTGWIRSCLGLYSGGSNSCSLNVLENPITGSCNISIDGNSYYTGSTPATGSLCSSGNLSGLNQGATGWMWTCDGQYSGGNQSCDLSVLNLPTTGSCNVSINGNFYYTGSAPNTGSLCSTGSLSGLNQDSSGRSRTCEGISSGGNQSCNLIILNTPITGSCNSSINNNSYFTGSVPATGLLCSSGTLSGLIQGSNIRIWNCEGQYSGSDENGCNLTVLQISGNTITGTCNPSYQGQVFTGTNSIITGVLCSSGNLSGLNQSTGSRTRNCLGSGGASSFACSLLLTGSTTGSLGGICGVSGSYSSSSLPSSGALCSFGTLSGFYQTPSSMGRSCVDSSGAQTSCGIEINIDDPYTCGGFIYGNFTGAMTGVTVYLYSGASLLYSFSPVISGGYYYIPIEYLNTGSVWFVNSGDYSIVYEITSGGLASSGGYSATITNSCSNAIGSCGVSGTYFSGSLPSTGALCSSGTLSGLSHTSSGRTRNCIGSGGADAYGCNLQITGYSSLLYISKTVSRATASIGDIVTWSIFYQNVGGGTLQNVVLDDFMTSAFSINYIQTMAGVGTGFTTGGFGYNFAIGTLSGFSSGSISFVTTVNNTANPGSYSNIATGSASGLNVVTGKASISIIQAINSSQGATYEPVPLPVPSFINTPGIPLPPVVSEVIKTTRTLIVRSREYTPRAAPDTGGYIPFYTQSIQIINNFKLIPATGVRRRFDWIIELFKKT